VNRRLRLYAVLALCLLLAACAADPVKQSRELIDQGSGEEALAILAKASREHADNRAYRAEYFRARDQLFAQWLAQAESLRLGAALAPAEALYRLVLRYEPADARAQAGLARIETDKRHSQVVADASRLVDEQKYDAAEAALRGVLNENPQRRDARKLQRVIEEKTRKPAVAALRLKSPVTSPITLELRDVALRAAFEVLSRATNLNFLFDKDVRADQRTTVVVRDAQVEDVVKLLLVTNQLESKVLNDTTALVFPNTQQKLREYQEQVVKSFYVSNADVRQTANMLRTILKARDVFVDEKSSLLVIKDSPSAVQYAERLIAAQDLAEPEAMLQVEVFEISYNRLLELGARFPTSLAVSVVGGGVATAAPNGSQAISGGTPGVISLPEWLAGGSSLVRLAFTDPLFLLSLRQQDGRTNLLANPQIRVKNREKAVVHIGDRVPVITTTAAATGSFVSQSVSYLDVGLKLEVEPLIYLDDDVGINVRLEVSSITNTLQNQIGGTLVYQIGTRMANTVLRLHDGETQILAGLISDEDRRSAERVPGLGELPILGRLFSSTSDTRNKSQIVLLITPRIVRALQRPDARSVEFSAGTEPPVGGPSFGGMISAPAPLTPATSSIAPTPPATAPTTSSPAPGAPPAGNTMAPFGGVR
jgi:general secretion pathway protein D